MASAARCGPKHVVWGSLSDLHKCMYNDLKTRCALAKIRRDRLQALKRTRMQGRQQQGGWLPNCVIYSCPPVCCSTHRNVPSNSIGGACTTAARMHISSTCIHPTIHHQAIRPYPSPLFPAIKQHILSPEHCWQQPLPWTTPGAVLFPSGNLHSFTRL